MSAHRDNNDADARIEMPNRAHCPREPSKRLQAQEIVDEDEPTFQ